MNHANSFWIMIAALAALWLIGKVISLPLEPMPDDVAMEYQNESNFP